MGDGSYAEAVMLGDGGSGPRSCDPPNSVSGMPASPVHRRPQGAVGRQALGAALFVVADKHIDEVLKSKMAKAIFR